MAGFISSDTNVWIDFEAIDAIELPFRLPCTYLGREGCGGWHYRCSGSSAALRTCQQGGVCKVHQRAVGRGRRVPLILLRHQRRAIAVVLSTFLPHIADLVTEHHLSSAECRFSIYGLLNLVGDISLGYPYGLKKWHCEGRRCEQG